MSVNNYPSPGKSLYLTGKWPLISPPIVRRSVLIVLVTTRGVARAAEEVWPHIVIEMVDSILSRSCLSDGATRRSAGEEVTVVVIATLL